MSRCFVGIWALSITGCFGFVLPVRQTTPPVAVEDPEVRAFKFIDDRHFFGWIIAGAINFGQTVEEVPVRETHVAGESDVYWKYYFFYLPVFFEHSHHRNLQVILYRRGYEPVVISSRGRLRTLLSNRPVTVAWREASSIVAREKVLDELPRLFHSSESNRGYEDFLSAEFTALSEDPAADAETRRRLLEKAKPKR